METCGEVALPLALAVSRSLRSQGVELSTPVLTSYLLEDFPDNQLPRREVKETVVRKQVDEMGRLGDVSVDLEKCENFEDEVAESSNEHLIVYRKDDKSKCVLVNTTFDNSDSVECFESFHLDTKMLVDKKDALVYRVKAKWHGIGVSFNPEDEEDSIVIIEDSYKEDDDSFLMLEEERNAAVEKICSKTSISIDDLQTSNHQLEIKTDDHTKSCSFETDSQEALGQFANTRDDKVEGVVAESKYVISAFSPTEVTNERLKEVTKAVKDELKQRRAKPDTAKLIQSSVRGNERKKLLVIGKTGTGKSSLCNVLTGNHPNAKIFPVSAKAPTCTQETTFADAFFCGDTTKPLSIIDTIGFDDPTKDHDAQIIAELVLQLQKNCDYINTFVMAVNGQNPRLDGSLLQMIRIFEKMFTDKFWDQVVVVFTRLHMDPGSKQRRMEESDGDTDDTIAKDYLAEVDKIFEGKGKRLNYLFIDSQYRKTDLDEVQAFTKETDQLFKLLMSMSNLPTCEVSTVLTENQKLWARIKQLKVAAGLAAGGGVAALGVASLKSAVAETAVKEAARAVAEKVVAESATAAAQVLQGATAEGGDGVDDNSFVPGGAVEVGR